MTWELDNTTYYDDDGLLYLLERIIAAARSLPAAPGYATNHDPVVNITNIVVRYYAGDAACTAKRGGNRRDRSDAGRLYIGLPRRNTLFGSGLETVAGLAGEDPSIPKDALTEISVVLLREVTDNSISNALRNGYSRLKEDKSWGWPEKAARKLIEDQVIAAAEVKIHDRSRPGSSIRAQITSAQDAVARRNRDLSFTTNERVSTEERLRQLLEKENRERVNLIAAELKLKKLLSKE